MAYGVIMTQEGVDALRQLSTSLLEQLEAASAAADKLQSDFDEVRAGVSHDDEVEEILEDIRVVQSNVASSVATLSQRTAILANDLEDFINSGLGN